MSRKPGPLLRPAPPGPGLPQRLPAEGRERHRLRHVCGRFGIARASGNVNFYAYPRITSSVNLQKKEINIFFTILRQVKIRLTKS